MEQPDDWMSDNKPYVSAWIASGIEPPKRMAPGSSTPSRTEVRFVIDGMATALAWLSMPLLILLVAALVHAPRAAPGSSRRSWRWRSS